MNRPSLVSRATPVALALGIVLWLLTLTEAHFSQMGAYGLVTLLHAPYWLGLAAIVTALALELTRPTLRARWLVASLVLLVLYLYGTACFVEPVSALTDSWIHAGFIGYIINHGQPLNNYDARFSWPGAFTLGALVSRFTGASTAVHLLRYFPLFIELAYMAPLVALARTSDNSARAGWLGVALFYATNWIYQDYFSPQGMAYLLFLVTIASLMALWRPRPSATSEVLDWSALRRLSQLRASASWGRLEGHHTESLYPGGTEMALLGILGLIGLALAISHQITPYAVVVVMMAMLFTRRLGRPEIVVLIVVETVAWLSLGASNFWIGHLSTIFGSVGQISNSIGSNVTSRVVGSLSHRLIVDGRILLIAAIFAVGFVGVLRRRADSRALEIMSGMPLMLIAAQGYGGEGLMRLVLFSLPFTTQLAGAAVFPRREGEVAAWVPLRVSDRWPRWVNGALAGSLVLVLAVGLSVVRGGNDAYESYSQGELNAMNWVYAHARGGNIVALVAPYAPFGQQAVGSISVQNVAGTDTPTIAAVRRSLVTLHPRWIYLSHAQEQWGVIVSGYRSGWEGRLATYMEARGYRVAATFSTATVLERTTR